MQGTAGHSFRNSTGKGRMDIGAERSPGTQPERGAREGTGPEELSPRLVFLPTGVYNTIFLHIVLYTPVG